MRDRPYAPPPEAPASAALDALTYGPLQEIRYPPGHALFAESPYPVTFFHLGNFFRHPVKVYALEGGQAREVLYAHDLFTYPAGNPAKDVPDGAGFAGFRFQKAPAGQPGDDGDWLAFLGASYFRAAGDGAQYGASARGIAIDTAPAPGRTEEFPVFTRFYVSPAADGAVTVLALLEGPSLTGAYRFVARKEPHVVIDVACTVYMRKSVERFGMAPLTSMLWYSEGMSRFLASDWRPEVHDSDGLLMQTGAGELIWRRRSTTRTASASAPSRTALRRASACSSATARTRITSTTASRRTGPTSGSSRRATGAGAASSSWRSRPIRKPTTTSSPSGCRTTRLRPDPTAASPTGCAGPWRNRSPPISPAASPHGPPRPRGSRTGTGARAAPISCGNSCWNSRVRPCRASIPRRPRWR